MSKHNFAPLIRVRLKGENVFWGNGVMELLKYIMQEESLKKACESMNMSYSKGYKLIKQAESDLGFSLIISHKGGYNGGSSQVTDEALDFMERFKNYKEAIETYSKEQYQYFF